MLIGQEKGHKLPNSQDHESKTYLESMAIRDTFDEVDIIIRGELDLVEASNQYFPHPPSKP